MDKAYRRWHVAVATVVGIVACWPSEGDACICRENADPSPAFENAEAVFTARAVELAAIVPGELMPPRAHELDRTLLSSNATALVTLDVIEVFKGSHSGRIVIETGWLGHSCAAYFRPGDLYLIFASKPSRSMHPFLWASQCSVSVGDESNPWLALTRAHALAVGPAK